MQKEDSYTIENSWDTDCDKKNWFAGFLNRIKKILILRLQVQRKSKESLQDSFKCFRKLTPGGAVSLKLSN